MSNDYFSHRPRSFLSAHTDFNEKITTSPTPNKAPSPPSRGRTTHRSSRLVGYEQPSRHVIPNAPGTRVPRTWTLIRVLLIGTLAVLATLGWRCESVGCKGRGGGALVGDYGHVGGGSGMRGVGWSGMWDAPSWGGERQGGRFDEGASTYDVFEDVGELVGGEDGEVVEWDDESGSFGSLESWGGDEAVHVVEQGVDAEKAQGKEQEQEQQPQDEVQNEKGETATEDKPSESYEAYDLPALAGPIAGPVGELTGPAEGAVKVAAANAVAQQDTESDAQPIAQEDESNVEGEDSLTHKLSSSRLGSVGFELR